MSKTKHTAKYRLRCNAPSELTEFNKEYNKKIEDTCFQKELYTPSLSCLENPDTGEKCPYLEIKGYR